MDSEDVLRIKGHIFILRFDDLTRLIIMKLIDWGIVFTRRSKDVTWLKITLLVALDYEGYCRVCVQVLFKILLGEVQP